MDSGRWLWRPAVSGCLVMALLAMPAVSVATGGLQRAAATGQLADSAAAEADAAAGNGAAVQAGPVWIDVRSPREFSRGHLQGAHNIPYDEIGERISELALAKDTPIMLYCRSGYRAAIAERTLRGLGYTQIENKGAYEDLRQPQP